MHVSEIRIPAFQKNLDISALIISWLPRSSGRISSYMFLVIAKVTCHSYFYNVFNLHPSLPLQVTMVSMNRMPEKSWQPLESEHSRTVKKHYRNRVSVVVRDIFYHLDY